MQNYVTLQVGNLSCHGKCFVSFVPISSLGAEFLGSERIHTHTNGVIGKHHGVIYEQLQDSLEIRAPLIRTRCLQIIASYHIYWFMDGAAGINNSVQSTSARPPY